MASACHSSQLQLVDAPTEQQDTLAEDTTPRPRYRFRNPYRKHTRRKHTPEECAAKSARMTVGISLYIFHIQRLSSMSRAAG